MAKIKWRQQDLKKLSSYARKFNAAITRMEKKNPELVGTTIIPSRITVADLRNQITTRKDYNRQLNKIDRFFRPGAKEIVTNKLGIKTTKWEQKEAQYLEQRINAKRRAYIKKYNVPKSQQKSLNLTQVDIKATQQRLYEKAQTLTDPEDIINNSQKWFNFLYTLERESQDDYYENQFYKLKNQYLKAASEHLSPEGYEQLKDLFDKNNIQATDILWAIGRDDTLDFEYFYSLEDAQTQAENVLELWNAFMPDIEKLRNESNSGF